VRRRKECELYDTRGIVVKEWRRSRLYKQRSREKRDKKIKELGKGNLSKRRNTEKNLAGYRIWCKRVRSPARRIEEICETYKERDR
jgi:hypothetical protein